MVKDGRPVALDPVQPGTHRCYSIAGYFSGDEKIAIIKAAQAENMNLATWLRKVIFERIMPPPSNASPISSEKGKA